MTDKQIQWLMTAVVAVLVVVTYAGLAYAGEPTSGWLFCKVLGFGICHG
ncbi:hypothetical protein NTE19_003397 [Vibrio fluvialis]|nr:hypothetical protein [Vibrio fluvialis]